ncbi:phage portal protein [Cereibacter sphaeroides f. sp. denitrificans]
MDYNFSKVLADRDDIPRGSGEAVVSALTCNHAAITRMVRAATRMNGLASRPADVTATYVIGKGMVPVCRDEKLMKLYRRWAKRVGADELGDMRFVQELAWREFFNIGEAFAYIRGRKPDEMERLSLPVGFQIQILQAEMVPTTLPFVTGQDVRGGQVYNSRGECTHYYIYKKHPGDRSDLTATTAQEVVKVSANLILHVMRQLEPGAVRGESALARALVKIHDLERYLGADLLRKTLSANIAYWLELPDLSEEEKERLADVFYDPTTGKYVNSEGEEVEPPASHSVVAPKDGTVAALPPGAKTVTTAPAESGNSFSPFVRQVGLHIALACNIPYEFLFLDAAGIQDRIYRGLAQQFERQVEMWRADFSAMFLTPIWNTFVRTAVASGAWSPPSETVLDDWLDVEWLGQPMPNLYRAQEVASWKTEVEEGWATDSDIIRRQGDDPERVRRERLSELIANVKDGLIPPPAHWTDAMLKVHLQWTDGEVVSYRALTRATSASEQRL